MLDNIIAHLPKDRQIMLYSATFPLSVESFMVCLNMLYTIGELSWLRFISVYLPVHLGVVLGK